VGTFAQFQSTTGCFSCVHVECACVWKADCGMRPHVRCVCVRQVEALAVGPYKVDAERAPLFEHWGAQAPMRALWCARGSEEDWAAGEVLASALLKEDQCFAPNACAVCMVGVARGVCACGGGPVFLHGTDLAAGAQQGSL
jgi:hypothetical protein